MAFLDRLVSDLIRNSTGFNARPFVRSIGGKNILLLGGAAIAGAIAADKMRAKGGPPQSAAPPPPPPPVPGTLTPTPPPPPSPIPRAAAAEPELPDMLLFAVVRTMVAGALADGEMHAEEKKLIESRLGESGLLPEHVRQIHKDMVMSPVPSEIAALVEDAADRELLYRFGALVVLADGAASELERSWLDRLGKALALDASRQRAMEQELFSETS